MDTHRTSSRLDSGCTGRDHYHATYSDSLDRQSEWLRRSAKQKVDTVCRLLARNRVQPETILEIGCGTGAVVAELQQRKIAQSYYAVDYSSEAIEFLKKNIPNVHTVVGDVMDCSEFFSGKKFDVIICSHVLEHLEEPEAFLASLSNLEWKHLCVEVPLENLYFGRIKARFQDRSRHPAGHVQFFDKSAFLQMFSGTGLNIMDEQVYAPVLSRDTLRWAYADGSRVRYIAKFFTEHFLPKNFAFLWSRFYHAHMAVLCEKIPN